MEEETRISTNIDIVGNIPCSSIPSLISFDKFINKYENKLNNPFLLGYLFHLYIDKKWFSELVLKVFNEQLNVIKPGAINISELSIREAFTWYMKKENFYHIFDIHDSIF